MDIAWTFADNGGGDLPAVRCARHYGPFRLEMRSGAQCRFERGETNFQHHHQGFYEFCVVLAGSGRFVNAGECHNLLPGSAFVADPEVRHEIQQDGESELSLVYWMVRLQRNERLWQNRDRSDMDVSVIDQFTQWHRPAWTATAWLQHWLHLLMRIDSDADAWRSEQLLGMLALEAMRESAEWCQPSPTVTDDTLVQRALALIEEQCGQEVTVATLAQHVQCSERHLRRLFQRSLGRSPVQVLIERRLNQAAQHILRGHSIGEAAQRVGIRDPSQFSRLFRAKFDCTPSHYRQLHASMPPALTWHAPKKA